MNPLPTIPRDFYAVYVLSSSPVRDPWGTITDGFCNRDEAFEHIASYFTAANPPTLRNMIALRIQDDVPPREVSDEFVEMWNNWQEEKAA